MRQTKPVIPRELASRDVEAAVDFYLADAGGRIALGFVESLEQAYRHIASQPASGSPRYGHELNLPGLRSWPLRRYPYLVFYVELHDRIDVWRVLHGQRDIPAWMNERADDPGYSA